MHMHIRIRIHARSRAVKRCTVKYAVIGSDVPLLLLRDFVLGGGGHENRVLVEREPKKDEMFFRWGHWIVGI